MVPLAAMSLNVSLIFTLVPATNSEIDSPALCIHLRPVVWLLSRCAI
jgi:hypothetical protein